MARTVSLLWVLMLPPLAASAQQLETGLTARVTGLRNDKGQIGCMVFASADGFPRQPNKAVARVFAPISGGAGTCKLAVKAGDYAMVAMHDENGNGKMDLG